MTADVRMLMIKTALMEHAFQADPYGRIIRCQCGQMTPNPGDWLSHVAAEILTNLDEIEGE